MKKTIKTYKYCAYIIVVSLFSACSAPDTQTADSEEIAARIWADEQIQEAGIGIGYILDTSWYNSLKANGSIELPPNSQASLQVPMQGYVRTVLGLEGQRVSKGQVLVELENPNYIEVQQNYLKAKAELLQKELDYERQSELLKEKATTAKQAELAKAAFQIAAAEVKALEEKLAYMGFDAQEVLNGHIRSIVKLRSPFNGIVHHVAVHKGEFVETQSRIMQVIDPSHMHAELQVFQSDFPLLKVGQTFSFKVPAFGADSEPFSGKIELLGRAVEEDSKTIRVHGHFKEDDRLIPGLFIEAEIASGLVKGWALPSSAVVWQKGGAYVFAAQKTDQGYIFERKAIEVGAHNDAWSEVLNPSEQMKKQQWVLTGADQLQAQIDLAEGDEE